jgi:xanthine dehydrogenase YagS FAD-binding subunit
VLIGIDAPRSIADAIAAQPGEPQPDSFDAHEARPGESIAFLAGGTDLIPLMRAGLVRPRHLIDLRRAGLPASIDETAGRLVIGAAARMADVAASSVVRARAAAVGQALLASASPQIRNAATIGGNLLQRTRCSYFRDPAFACNKRAPGSGCPAQRGPARRHAVIGASAACAAVHASDLAVALVALDAELLLCGPTGARRVALGAFYLEPGETPWRETALAERELIAAVEIPPTATASAYVKVRDRASFDFALVAAAAALRVEEGRVAHAAIALGGIAPRPWRLPDVEEALRGQPLSADSVAEALRGALAGARPLVDNRFKVDLARRAAARAIAIAGSIDEPR